jgi:hypothetical protein
LELVDRKGIVLDKSTFSGGADISPLRWSKDCQTIMVGTDQGLAMLYANSAQRAREK